MQVKSIRGHSSCEICEEPNQKVLDLHHIIPRSNPLSTDKQDNLTIICSNCHRRVHAGEIIIEGVYMTSTGPRLITHHQGEPYCIRPGFILGPGGSVDILEE